MIRPLTCVCMLLAGGSGLYLYQSKHQAQMLDREIARTLKAAETARDRIGVLRGEWALLNEPDRLAGLSQLHLGLKTLTPGQFVTAAELGARLPPVAMPGVPAAPEEDAPDPVAAMPPAPVAPLPSRTSFVAAKQAPAASSQLAAALPPSTSHSAARREDPTPPRPPMQSAAASPIPLAPMPKPARPILAPVVNVSASPIAAPRPAQARTASLASGAATPARPAAQAPESPPGDAVMRVAHVQEANAAARAPAYSPPMSTPSASVLGGARPQLPPPVPYGSATAASFNTR